MDGRYFNFNLNRRTTTMTRDDQKRRIQILLDVIDMGDTRTASELANFALVPETQDTCPTTRGLIREMISEGTLIGGNSKGYHIMRSGKQVQQCLNSLLKRQMGISKRIQALYDAAKQRGVL